MTIQQLINQLMDAPNLAAPVYVFDRIDEDWLDVTRVEFENQGDDAQALIRYESEDHD